MSFHIQHSAPQQKFLWLLFSTAAGIMAIDQASKLWVINNLPSEEIVLLGEFLRFTYVENSGAAFGIFANQTFLLSFVSVAVILSFFAYYWYTPFNSPAGRLAIGLLLGGSISNLIDRFRLHHVVDFIDIGIPDGPRWFVFNLADSAIVVGIFILAFILFYTMRKEAPSSQRKR